MAEFVPSKGWKNCPKCNGWQVLDLTKRAVNGWPIGPFNYVDCDHCSGRGEVRDEGAWPKSPEPAWQLEQPKARRVPTKPSGPVVLDDDIPMPTEAIDEQLAGENVSRETQCPHAETVNVWGKVKCKVCGEEL